MKKLVLFITLLMTFIIAQPEPGVPNSVSFQGMLTTVDGAAYDDGDYELTFRLIRTLQDGNEQIIWEETHTTPVNHGVFSVILGGMTDFPENIPGNAMLETQVGEEILSPRQPLTSVPFAFRSNRSQNSMHSIHSDSSGFSEFSEE